MECLHRNQLKQVINFLQPWIFIVLDLFGLKSTLLYFIILLSMLDVDQPSSVIVGNKLGKIYFMRISNCTPPFVGLFGSCLIFLAHNLHWTLTNTPGVRLLNCNQTMGER